MHNLGTSATQAFDNARLRRHLAAWGWPLALLLLNICVIARLFRVEYSAHLGSNEGQFIFLAHVMAQRFGDLSWWPEWACGLPFQNTYLPLLQAMVALFSRISGHSAALSFHQVSSALYCLGPVCVYLLAKGMTRRPGTSFAAAAAYSLFSPCVLIPDIRGDVGGIFNLRRLQILAFYGEGPHTAAMALVPLAILYLYRAITRGRLSDKALAGVFSAAAILANAFAAVILAMAAAALLATWGSGRFWRNLALLAAIGALAYAWISPAMPPSVVAAIRMNSPTIEGDFRLTPRSAAGAAILAAGFGALWLATRRRAPEYLRFFLLMSWTTAAIVALGYFAKIYVVPQPHRYQIAMDLSMCLLAVFGAQELLRRFPPRVMRMAAAALVLVFAAQLIHATRYAHSQIGGIDVTRTAMYRVARWADRNMGGRRIMVSGSYSFYFNNFTDTPQMHGAQEPMLPSILMRIATYMLYAGADAAGPRYVEMSATWLKALGAHAIVVPGPGSEEYYKPFRRPEAFEGRLPLLWREGGDSIYAVPGRSASLAHVMAVPDLVRDQPYNGLDTAQMERYVAAMDSPAYPLAEWRWTSRHGAAIKTVAAPGQVVSAQVNYHPGWRASVNGAERPVSADGLGLLVVKPGCDGPCEISLRYDGGPELRLALAASAAVTLLMAALAAAALRRARATSTESSR